MKVRTVELDDTGKPIVAQEQVIEDNQEEIIEETQEEEEVEETETQEEESSEEEQEEEVLEEEEEEQEEVEESTQSELDEQTIIDYIKNNYDSDVESLTSLLNKEEKEPELPESIKKLLDYQKETGRGIEDYVNLNKNWDEVADESVIRSFLKYKKPHLDDEEIDFEIKRRFSYDEEIDDDSEIYGKRIAKKDFIYEAKKFFNEMKESYSAPIESMNAEIPDEYKEALNFVNEYKQNLNTKEEKDLAKQKAFLKQTDELFNSQFEGFEFKVTDDKSQVFKPTDVAKTKQIQSDISNFFNKFLDKDGNIKDAASYHKSLAVALDPDSFARFFYEQGQSDAVENLDKESKNLDMNLRGVHETKVNDSGMKVRAFTMGENDSPSMMKIRG